MIAHRTSRDRLGRMALRSAGFETHSLTRVRNHHATENACRHAGSSMLAGVRSCMAKLRKIAAACAVYAQEHDGCFPRSLAELYPDYIPDVEDFVCPSAVLRRLSPGAGPAPGARAVYSLVPGLKSGTAPDRVLVCDATAWNHRGLGRNVAYADGHVTWLPGDDAGLAARLPGRRAHARAHANGRDRHGRSKAG